MSKLPRYGIQWNGPDQPIATEMPDGYWTPWHIAEQERRELIEKAYRQGWRDCFNDCNPDVGMNFGPETEDEGFERFLEGVNGEK